MNGENELSKVEKLVAVDWPQGKRGHLEVTGLAENVQVTETPAHCEPQP